MSKTRFFSGPTATKRDLCASGKSMDCLMFLQAAAGGGPKDREAVEADVTR